MENRIVKTIELAAPLSRVWEAIADHRRFGAWFRVHLDQPSSPGALSTGHMTYPGYEHYPWRATIEAMEPMSRFAFRWHHFDDKSGVKVQDEPTTLVEFLLEETSEGTRLTIIESGFESLPDPRRLEILRGNTQGWDIQATNIEQYVAQNG